jgi:glyoxylase-like metal-dependent hydrolase (beta-lactamase superfamily II)
MAKIVKPYGFDTVPLLSTDFKLADTVDAILLQADGDTVIYPGHMREGIVFRTSDGVLSFKAVSNKYLLKNEE